MPGLMLNILLSYLAFISTTTARLVVHERRDKFLADQGISRDVLLPMRIGLRENLHAQANAEKWLMEVSSSDSPLLGQHWSQAEVIEIFKPSSETIRNVTEWLKWNGISAWTHSDNKLWFAFDLPASRAEALCVPTFRFFQTTTVTYSTNFSIPQAADTVFRARNWRSFRSLLRLLLPTRTSTATHPLHHARCKGSDVTDRTSKRSTLKRDSGKGAVRH